ncbi:MAG: glutathione S-transferase N-terminal domain-containing protein [Chloroflexota bacterium]
MIKLYLWTTPNGRKPLILLEELGVPYEMIPIRLNGQQKTPEYLAINPNGRIPSMIDEPEDGEPITVFESGAIMIYLAEKYGQFLPSAEPARSTVIQWVMFQMGGIGPMLGQYYHFKNASENLPYAINRYLNETERLYGVLEIRLSEAEYLGGDDYSIADMITYPWVYRTSNFGFEADKFPNVERWIKALAARPAVEKAMNISLS